MNLRSSNPHSCYKNGFTVNFLSMAGLANIDTEMGILKKVKVSPKDESKLLTTAAATTLRYYGTDEATLAYLVPNIFTEEITHQALAVKLMTRMGAEMLKLGSHVGLDFSPTSPPVIIENPNFEKKWFFEGNPGEDLRDDTKDRSGPARWAGDKKYNPIMAIYGLFILQTTDPIVKPLFSISDIPEKEKVTVTSEEIGIPLIRPQSIIKRNLLEPISYTSYWKNRIDAFDFSSIPDEDISEVGSVTEAIYVLKQMEYTFATDNYNQDNPLDDEFDVFDVFDGVPPVDHMPGLPPSPPPPVVPDIASALKKIARTTNIPNLISSLQGQKSRVDALQTMISELDERGYALGEQIKFLEGKIQTRLTTEALDGMQNDLEDIEKRQLVALQGDFAEAKVDEAQLERRLEQEKHRIMNEFNGFIDTTLKLGSIAPKVKATIKNIIMRNKLKNILKLGIRDKRLTLSQVLIFFRSLGYDIVNIVDPSCFTLKNPPKVLPETQVDSQELFPYRNDGKSDTERLDSAMLSLQRDRTPSPPPAPGPAPGPDKQRESRKSEKSGGSRKSHKKTKNRIKSKRKARIIKKKTQKIRRHRK
jgi:hypothetical protein